MKTLTTASLFALLCFCTVEAQPPAPPKPQRWTHAEATRLYAQTPDDPYLQYLVIQTARREKVDKSQLSFLNQRGRLGRREGADLFSTFTGALAIQESLQLDTMMGPEDRRARRDDGQPIVPGEKEKEAVKLASLTGPTIQSHPWEKMLAGRKANVGTMAKFVPEDFYFIEFQSAKKMMEALHASDLWSGHLFAQMMGSAQSVDLEKRLKTQLGIQGIPPALLDAVGLTGIGVTGSDLYLGDGSDITLLVQGEKLVALRQWLDAASAKQAGVNRTEGKYLDINYVHTTSADRTVHFFAADPKPDLHVRSNSLPALQKVLATIAGKNDKGEAVKNLGDSTEFAFIRTIMPRGAEEEDGLIYLSDPCIRRLLGPRVKLTQQRRLMAFNHLKMIERAALMFRSETGRAPKSFEELASSGCAPGVFGKDAWACPSGGTYVLSDDGMSARSSIFGTTSQLTPLLEVPLEQVTGKEASDYQNFLREYSQYWRTFFDPIAVRVKVTPEQFRLETVVLPLIDNSIYTGLSQAIGGKTVPMATVPRLPGTIHAVTAHVNKELLLKQLPGGDGKLISSADALHQLMVAMHLYHEDFNSLPPASSQSKDGKPLMSWRVALLPYLGDEARNVFSQYKPNEPWDSENNKKLIEKMPAIYRSGFTEWDGTFKTRYLVPVGENTVFPANGQKVTLAEIGTKNGTSNTIAIVEAATTSAVIWTKPDDLVIDFKQPHKGLGDPKQLLTVVTCDGSPYQLREISPSQLSTLLQWKDTTEPTSIVQHGVALNPRIRRSPFDLPEIDYKLLREFLEKGIGEHVSYQVLDASQPITSDVTTFMGSRLPMAGFGNDFFGSEMLFFGMLIQSLTNPACIVVPLQQADIVDRFLVEVDKQLAALPRGFQDFVQMEQYQIPVGENKVRIYSIKLLGISFRIAWARMGNYLVVTNQPTMLPELHQYYSKQAAPSKEAATKKDDQGHAQFSIYPDAWKQVLPGYRLGWAENHRVACGKNQQCIANIARSYPELVKTDGTYDPKLLTLVRQQYGQRIFCPDGGSYKLLPGGQCECSIHGCAHINPQQPLEPSKESDTMKSLAEFKGLNATLTFLEDGLHAVLVLKRK
jgi:hypothetical protein